MSLYRQPRSKKILEFQIYRGKGKEKSLKIHPIIFRYRKGDFWEVNGGLEMREFLDLSARRIPQREHRHREKATSDRVGQ